MYACIAFKNFLLGDKCNEFDPCYHGFECENPLVLSMSARRKLAWWYEASSEYNRNFTTEVLCCMSHCIKEATKMEFLGKAAALVKEKTRDAVNSNSGADRAALSNVKSFLQAPYDALLQTLYDDTHASKTDASKKRAREAEVEEGEQMIRGVTRCNTQRAVAVKYRVKMSLNSNTFYAHSSMTTIKAANAAKHACEDLKKAWKEKEYVVTAENLESAKETMHVLCDEKEAKFGVDSQHFRRKIIN